MVAAPRENLGFKMLVHPKGESPNLRDYGIELQPGTQTPVRLDVMEMSSLPSPYGECGNKTLRYFDDGYTESKCYLECETDYIVGKCGCRDFYMPGGCDLYNCLFAIIIPVTIPPGHNSSKYLMRCTRE